MPDLGRLIEIEAIVAFDAGLGAEMAAAGWPSHCWRQSCSHQDQLVHAALRQSHALPLMLYRDLIQNGSLMPKNKRFIDYFLM